MHGKQSRLTFSGCGGCPDVAGRKPGHLVYPEFDQSLGLLIDGREVEVHTCDPTDREQADRWDRRWGKSATRRPTRA